MPTKLTPAPDVDELTPEDAAEIEAAHLRRMVEVLDDTAPLAGGDVAEAALASMEARARKLTKPIDTPWRSLNLVLGGGLWPGLHVLTGSTGSGKTQFALQIGLRAAFQGMPVLYVGLELNRDELVARLFSIMLADHDGPGAAPAMWSDLYLGKDLGLIERAHEDCAPVLAKLPFRIEQGDGGEWSAADLEMRARAMAHRYAHRSEDGAVWPRWPLIVLDYLQLVGPEPEARVDLRERIRSAAMRARNVARLGATVVLLSSVSRENARLLTPATGKDVKEIEPLGQGDPSRLVGLGKESGEIEFSADTVLALGREDWSPGGTPMHLAAAKVRAGRPGWIRLSFNGSTFTERSAFERVA